MTNNFNTLVNNSNLLSILKTLQDTTFKQLNCMRIGIISKIISPTEVFCSITNKMLMSTNADGSGVWKEYPQIYARVWFMGGAETGINHKLSIGSPVLMLFNDREMDSYFNTGEISTLSSLRAHSLNDCIAIPLYQPKELTMGLTAASESINLNATTINLNATTININAEKINITGELIINGKPYLQHTHSNGNNGSPTGGVIT